MSKVTPKYDLTPEMQRKMAKRIIIRIAVLVAIVIAVYGYFRFDVQPPDDADLRLAPLKLPDEQNAAWYFDQALAEIRWPGDAETVEAMMSDVWDQELAERFVAENAAALALADKGLACTGIEVPLSSDNGPDSGYSPLATLMLIETHALFNAGREREAFDRGMKLLQFGGMLQESRGGPIYFLHGSEVRRQVLAAMRDFLATTTLSSETIAGYIQPLADLRAGDEVLDTALRAGYEITLDRIENYPRDIFFLPNETKRLYAETYRRCLQDARRLRYLHTAGMPVSVNDVKQRAPFFELIGYVARNSMGKGLHNYDILLGRMMASKCRENTDLSATQILFALKCHTLQTGAFPATLDELVPQYFRTVPVSDYDGRPIRYSRETSQLWCAGDEGEELAYSIEGW